MENNKDWAEQLVQKADTALDAYEFDIGLPDNVIPGSKDEFKNYLTMDITALEKMTGTQCANISYRLTQFSLYIQRCLNREKAKAKTLNKKINAIIAPKMKQYSGPWEIQIASAVGDDTAAVALSSELSQSQARQERLEFVSSGIKSLSEQMKTIQFSKRENNG
jgi:hypothetical protein